MHSDVFPAMAWQEVVMEFTIHWVLSEHACLTCKSLPPPKRRFFLAMLLDQQLGYSSKVTHIQFIRVLAIGTRYPTNLHLIVRV